MLVGAVEELGEMLLYCAGRLLGEGHVAAGEGAVFFAGPGGGGGRGAGGGGGGAGAGGFADGG